MKTTGNNLIGQKFYRLTVLKFLGKKSGHNNYLCKCDCGNLTEALPTNFKSGKVKSCGCLKKETKSNLKHGLKKHYLYKTWLGIKNRCYSKRSKSYLNYGARGIKIYKPWKDDFQLFYNWIIENLGDKPTKFYSLDRINNNGDYEPNNLRWATSSEQAQNSSISKINSKKAEEIYRLFTIDNKTIKEISSITNCDYQIIYRIVTGRNWNNVTGLPRNR